MALPSLTRLLDLEASATDVRGPASPGSVPGRDPLRGLFESSSDYVRGVGRAGTLSMWTLPTPLSCGGAISGSGEVTARTMSV